MKQPFRFLLFVLVIFATLMPHCLFAQKQGQALVDSLLAELPRQKEDTNKVILLGGLSFGCVYINPELGTKYGEQSLALATKLKWKKGIAGALNDLGLVCEIKADYTRALEQYFKALDIYKEIGFNNGIARVVGNIGIVYQDQSDYPKALSYYLQALQLYEEMNNKIGVASVTCNIGIVYKEQSNYPKALEYYFRALKIMEELGNKHSVASVRTNIGNLYIDQSDYANALDCYFKALKIDEELKDNFGIAQVTGNIGIAYQYQKDFTRALDYDFKALKIDESIGNKNEIETVTGNIGLIYQNLNNFPKALQYDLKALKIDQEIGDTDGIAEVTGNMGEVYLSMVDSFAAKSYKEKFPEEAPIDYTFPKNRNECLRRTFDCLNRALALGSAIHAPLIMNDCYRNLAKAYKISGDYKKSLDASEKYHAIKDSIFNKENEKKIIQQGMQYDYDKKEAVAQIEQEKKDALAAKELQRQKMVRNGFGGGFVVVLVFAGIFLSQRNKIKEGKKQSDELLLNILPAEVAEELKEKGTADAKLIDDVTVLFTDFKGFTQLSERLTPQALVAEINTCFSAFDMIMQKYGVEKIKTIGDAYMAAGGLPTPNQTHATDVVKAAVEIQHYMAKHKAEKLAKNELFFEIRIGVHTGPVVAGIVGIKKFQYDIWGDTVNTASRMESSGEAGNVNISETTYNLVKDSFHCEYRGEIKAKNKGDMKMYFVG